MTILTAKNYRTEAELAETPVLIAFCTAKDRSRCEGELERLPSLKGDKIKLCTVDAEQEEGLAAQFDLLSLPSLVLLRNGEIQQRIQGLPGELSDLH